MKVKILYEDNHLIAVFKPAGVLSQRDSTGDLSMLEEVKKYLKEKYKKQGKVFLGLLHRLDRPVSGIILFAKTSKGASRLSEQFRNHAVEKIYHAIVMGKPKKQRGILVNSLVKNRKNLKAIARSGLAMGSASLFYEVVPMPKASMMIDKIGIKSNEKYSLLKVQIGTGKFHQIRAQLSAAGFPILGDVKYGGQSWDNPKSIALCATNLSFKKVTEDEIVHLEIVIPKEWSKYL